MAWTTPRTYSTGELITATIMNTHIRDNLNFLYNSVGAEQNTAIKNDSTQVTTTSASFVDVHADLEITLTIKTGRVLLVFVGMGYLDTAPTAGQLTFNYDGTDLGVVSYWSSNFTPITAVAIIDSLSAASHTFKPRMKRASGTNNPGIYVNSDRPARFMVWEF